MAQQRIRQSKLPEILAQFGRTGPGEAIKEGLSGFKEGASLAATIAARKAEQEKNELLAENLKQKIAARQKELGAQEKLFQKQKKLEEIQTKGTETPVSSAVPKAKLGNIALTESSPELEAPDTTGQAVIGLGDTSKLVKTATPQPSLAPQPTGETGEALIPDMTSDLKAQVEQYKREAYPELYGKTLSKEEEAPSALDVAKTETEKAKQAFLKSRTTKTKGTVQDTPLEIRSQAQKVAEQKIDNRWKYGIPPSKQEEADLYYEQEYQKALQQLQKGKITPLESEVTDLGILGD